MNENKQVVVHRIIKVSPSGYLLKGDNNQGRDGWFDKNEILGVVEKIEKTSGAGHKQRHWQNKLIALCSRTSIFDMRRNFIFLFKKNSNHELL